MSLIHVVLRRCCGLVLLIVVLGACASATPSTDQPIPAPTLFPTNPVVPTAESLPSATSEPADSGWQAMGNGIDLRRLNQPLTSGALRALIVRVDPALVTFRVGYSPDQPKLLDQWLRDAGAAAVINGGFFDAQNRTTSLLIQAGVPIGDSYVGRGGMFAVDPAGNVSLRYLGEQAYDPSEVLSEALQGWPMLVRPGGSVAYTFEDEARDRRSVLALDRSGRVLLIAVETSVLTLRELAEWLAASDLDLHAALNLDGGSSTGLALAPGSALGAAPSILPVPIVLMVLPK